jgi:hypothetical protein
MRRHDGYGVRSIVSSRFDGDEDDQGAEPEPEPEPEPKNVNHETTR